jgi:hypothetical protein
VTDDEIIAAVRRAVDPARRTPPASVDVVVAAERQIGFRMPTVLRRLYLEVGNGGFGPYGGVVGVGESTRGDGDIVSTYASFCSHPNGSHPAGVVPILDWGCAVWSLVDFRDPSGPMWGWEPNASCLDHALFPQGIPLAVWLDPRRPARQPYPSFDYACDCGDWWEDAERAVEVEQPPQLSKDQLTLW